MVFFFKGDVGGVVWLDTGDIWNKSAWHGVWDSFCFIENVRFPTLTFSSSRLNLKAGSTVEG
jgi:hypothetical protein